MRIKSGIERKMKRGVDFRTWREGEHIRILGFEGGRTRIVAFVIFMDF